MVHQLVSLACGRAPGDWLTFRNLPLLAIAVNIYSFFGNKVSDRPSNSGSCPEVLLMAKAFPRPIALPLRMPSLFSEEQLMVLIKTLVGDRLWSQLIW